ncbi:MAG: hypothetical protein H6Q12_34 [Bacteroidetes bacterium]|nr:hypothetical protein [Bacteroidota bacterium]
MDIEKISTFDEEERFKAHISNEKNKRIIFSGKFGMGKTFFINNFFERFNNEYHKIYLSPVNYSVSNNEDIFEYIKYDILSQLLQLENIEDYLPKETESEKLLSLSPSNVKDVLLPFIKCIPSVGGIIGNMIEGLIKLQESLDKVKKDNKISSFLEKIQENRGSIYDQNCITEIISFIISQLNSKGKKTVLIIDDLDRMDPEHIFRILNVFAVHFNGIENDNNKFNIDKVMIVCDIENIKNIFIHRYGKNVDFNGYIDKFYSTVIFEYRFINELINSLYKVLNKTRIRRISVTQTHDSDLVEYLITSLLRHRRLTIRQLVSATKADKIGIGYNYPSPLNDFYLILEVLYGNYDNMEQSIKDIPHISKDNLNIKIIFFIKEVIDISKLNNFKFESKSFFINESDTDHLNFTIEDLKNNLSIQYNRGDILIKKKRADISYSKNDNIEKFPLWDYLLEIFKYYHSFNKL